MIGLWSVNKTVGCFDPSIENSFSVRVRTIAVHSLLYDVSKKFYAC